MSRNLVGKILICGGFLMFVAGILYANAIIVDSEKPCAVIVIAEKATRSAQLGAEELRYHIKLITGTELQIIKENEKIPENHIPIYVGTSEPVNKMGYKNNSFNEQEYLVKITDQYIILTGHDSPDYGKISYKKNGAWPGFKFKIPEMDLGTLYAVYDFLENSCDVRWYMPTEIGTTFPSKQTLTVPNKEIKYQPWTTARIIGQCSWAKPGTFGKPDIMGYIRNKHWLKGRDSILYGLRNRYRADFNFNAHPFHSYDKIYGKAHPEWFVGASPGPHIQLRFWKKEVVEQVVKNITLYFDEWDSGNRVFKNPLFRGSGFGDIFAIGPNDNRIFGSKCQPPLQLKRKIKNSFSDGIASNYWFTFVKKVAEKIKVKFPGKWIASSAYASHYEPPDFDLPDNVAVSVCNTEGWDEGSYGLKNLRDWRPKVKRLFTYEYWYSHSRLPKVRPHKVAAYITQLRKINIEGMFMELISMANPAVYHLDYYITMRMLFERDANIDSILKEYYSLFYGPAAEPMKHFWETLENVKAKEDDYNIKDTNKLWVKISTTDLMEKLGKYLKQAEMMAKEDPYKTRLQIIRTGVYEMMLDRISQAKIKDSTKLPVIKVTKTDSKPTIDGKLDDSVWKDAPKTRSFIHMDTIKPNTNDNGKIAWDGENLYIGLTLEEPFMKDQALNQKEPSSGVCVDDSIEIMLDPGKTLSKKDYLHVMSNANGVIWYRIKRYAHRGMKPADLGIQCKTWRGDDKWTVEMMIPLKKLNNGKLPKSGDVWGLNLYRNRHTKFKANTKDRYSKTWTGWSPTFGSYHNLERFGILKFK